MTSTTGAPAPSPAASTIAQLPTCTRRVMLGLLLAATLINGIDRADIPVAAPSMSRELGIDEAGIPTVLPSLGATAGIRLANVVTSDAACIAILTGAFLAQGTSATSWAAVSEVAPAQRAGLTSGIASLGANLAGIVTSIAIGFIVRATGSFERAPNFVGLLAPMGALPCSLLLGRLHRIIMPDGGVAAAPLLVRPAV